MKGGLEVDRGSGGQEGRGVGSVGGEGKVVCGYQLCCLQKSAKG
jgi:hypothetical protein